MNGEQAAALRAPFDAANIGKLPRVTCGKCRDSRERACESHAKAKCQECGNWITSAHIHLDYVGHADITDRLLAVDPQWTWEPLALDEGGLPLFDAAGGLWIRLTVAGVTRLGYGDADGKRGANAVKEAIGDALRNAGMRFGIALDLWRKERVDETSTPAQQRPRPRQAKPSGSVYAKAAEAIGKAQDRPELEAIGKLITDRLRTKQLTEDEAVQLRRQLVARIDELNPGATPADEWPEVPAVAP